MSRDVTLAQRRVEMAMHACAAGGSTYAVGAAALEDVRDVERCADVTARGGRAQCRRFRR